MTNQTVKEYTLAIREDYRKLDKKGKSEWLNHAVRATKRSRKTLIRRLSEASDQGISSKANGRPCVYSRQELLPHIQYLWQQMERISARRMKAAFADWLPRYQGCPSHLRLQLERMSSATLDRYLRQIKSSELTQKGLSATSPARYMKNKVPINTLNSQITKPGYVQTDTVAHCGSSAAGPFISSITVTDVFSTWTENRALVNKTGYAVTEAFKSIERSVPFPLLAINSDSGSEFLNRPMLRFTNYGQRVTFTRSRPYKKNDNCFVEQKNFTHVRELFGYERFEGQALVDLMNEIYTEYWNPLQNFFLPSFKLKEKIRIGGRIKKKYDAPQTPYQRLIQNPCLSSQQKDYLRDRKAKLDPFVLKAGLEKKLQEFFDLVRKNNIRKVA